MRLASKAALLLSPDLRAIAREVRAASDLVIEATRHAGNYDPRDECWAMLREAHARLSGVSAVLEGRDPNRG